MQFGSTDQTVQITTGNFRTTMDLFDATQLNNKAQNALGTAYIDNAVSVANPNGLSTKYRYVRYNSTANPAVQANPAAVWWKDATFTVVTGVKAEGWGGESSFAGLLMPNTVDFPGLTNLKLNGNFVWIAVAGFVAGVVHAGLAAGAQQVATSADWTVTGGFGTFALGVAATNRVAAYVFGASPSNVYVAAESL